MLADILCVLYWRSIHYAPLPSIPFPPPHVSVKRSHAKAEMARKASFSTPKPFMESPTPCRTCVPVPRLQTGKSRLAKLEVSCRSLKSRTQGEGTDSYLSGSIARPAHRHRPPLRETRAPWQGAGLGGRQVTSLLSPASPGDAQSHFRKN